MHKDTRWAQQIISLQDEEGKWGYFHTLFTDSKSPITTEKALKRLEILGYTIEDNCIKKAVSYMDDCLTGIKKYQIKEKSFMTGIYSLHYCLLPGSGGLQQTMIMQMRLPKNGLE